MKQNKKQRTRSDFRLQTAFSYNHRKYNFLRNEQVSSFRMNRQIRIGIEVDTNLVESLFIYFYLNGSIYFFLFFPVLTCK